MKFCSLALVVLLAAPTAFASDIDELATFIDSLSAFSADFEQTVYDADSNPIQHTKGAMILKRPGRFVWAYTDPDPQQIIADGTDIWLYDIELQQVTVSPLSDRAGGTPLALLMGTVPLTEAFDVESLGASEDINWFELKPRDGESDFELVFLGLSESGGEQVLAAMELRDNFGQATQIQFSQFDRTVDAPDSRFDFEPPDGVDVIGEASAQ